MKYETDPQLCPVCNTPISRPAPPTSASTKYCRCTIAELTTGRLDILAHRYIDMNESPIHQWAVEGALREVKQ